MLLSNIVVAGDCFKESKYGMKQNKIELRFIKCISPNFTAKKTVTKSWNF